MYLNAQVQIETHKNALIIPAEAIYRDESGKSRKNASSRDLEGLLKSRKAAKSSLSWMKTGRCPLK